jgi:hypothetical protein
VEAYVDTRQNIVECDGRQWWFDLDCRTGVVNVTLGRRTLRMRRISWREKRTLARFVHLGETFLKEQFILIALGGNEALPEDESEREALWALAHWLNGPDGQLGLPLDQRLLASVTFDLCRAMQLAPAAFEDMEASDVETLWQAAQISQPQPAEESGGARIVVVPDPAQDSTEAPQIRGGRGLSDITSATAPTGAQKIVALKQKEINFAVNRSGQVERHGDDESEPAKAPPKLRTDDGTVTPESANRFRVVMEPVRTNRAVEKFQPLYPELHQRRSVQGKPQGRTPAAAKSIIRNSEVPDSLQIKNSVHQVDFHHGESSLASSLSTGAPQEREQQWHQRGAEARCDDETITEAWLDEFADRLQDAARAVGVDVEVQ